MVAVASLIFAGCFAKILIIILYSIMLDDSGHMSDCNSELIKQIKLRYSNQIKLDLPIQDAEKFVSRYIYQYSKIIKVSGILDMLSMILMLLGIAINYEKQYFEMDVLFIALFIYLCLGLLVAGEKKERIIVNNISDYLVNNMSTRMAAKEHRVQVKETMKAEVKEASEETKSITKEAVQQVKEPFKNMINNRGMEENAIIEEVLREFLQV